MTVQLIIPPATVFSSGVFAPGAQVFFYLSGTTTDATVYTDQAATTPHNQPVVANGAGVLPQVFYDGSSELKAVIQTATGATIETIDPIPSTLGTSSPSSGLASLGLTATAAELNTLDGITATTAELNTLDGITATVTELNHTDGVTSNIQTQLDAKVSTELSQAQVEDSADTTFGAVSGERLSQAIAVGVPTELNASGSAPMYACRAWVNFNGTGTVAIRASGNVSSITDNGVGDYTVNFTTAMPDADYAVSATGGARSDFPETTGIAFTRDGGLTTSSVRVLHKNDSNSELDANMSVAIFR